jgi:hypothetical protein
MPSEKDDPPFSVVPEDLAGSAHKTRHETATAPILIIGLAGALLLLAIIGYLGLR